MPPKPPRIGLPFVNPSRIPRVYTSTASAPTAVISFPITLKILGPQESSPIDRVFKSPEALSTWVSSHKRAALKAFATPTQKEEFFSRSDYPLLDPKRTYGVYAPLHSEEMEDIRHNQIADKAFEDKCRLAMAKFLKEQGQQVEEQDRVLYNLMPESSPGPSDNESPASSPLHTSTLACRTKSDVAIKWDGVWKDGRRIYYLLECKHFMTAVFMPNMPKLIEL